MFTLNSNSMKNSVRLATIHQHQRHTHTHTHTQDKPNRYCGRLKIQCWLDAVDDVLLQQLKHLLKAADRRDGQNVDRISPIIAARQLAPKKRSRVTSANASGSWSAEAALPTCATESAWDKSEDYGDTQHIATHLLYIGWQWRNFFISYLCQLFSAILWGKLCEMFLIRTSLSE